MKHLIRLMLSAGSLSAATLHVSPGGNDSNPGDAGAPVATLAKARDLARSLAGKEAVTIELEDGTYYLPETLVLGPPDSGTKAFPVTWRAANPGKAVLSGGMKLDLAWKPWKDGILQAETPAGLAIDQLFIGGARQRMARYPNYDRTQPTAAYQGYSADATSKERAARWADPAGGYIHAMHVSRWGGYHYRITGKSPDGSLQYEGGWQNNRRMGMHRDYRMVENILEELDAPGEWFHDAKKNTLYCFPEPDTDPVAASVEVVRLARLVELAGSMENPVRHVSFSGCVFRHSARTFMENKEPLLRSDWTIDRSGAVLLTGTEDVSITDCEFDQPGGNAVFVNRYNRRVRVKGCHIHDTGASGVCFVGSPDAVRDPLFEYNETRDLTTIDLTPGPKSADYPADCAVEDSLIHGIGRVERQPAAVQVSMSARIAMRDLSIHDCARAGINIGDGCWGGHLIERCDVFDTVLETHDHGSFNSWGRDRYWTSDHRGVSGPLVLKNPELPFLDCVETTVIRDSRWRCDHGWDIDLDDGSSNYDIYRNLLLGGGLKFREGFGRKAHNNIIVNNGMHPHVWFARSGDSVTGNLLMAAHANIGMPEDWQPAFDRNFFTNPLALAKVRALGSDPNSMAIEAAFVDPANGDYRLKPGSPALAAGFENFPMDRFGVKKPSLRKLAGTPVIPTLKTPAAALSGEPVRYWLGARLHSLRGEEFSAFGTRREDGGVQLASVPKGSAADLAELRENDLVQKVNGRPTRDLAALFAELATAAERPLELQVVRNQRPQELTLRRIPQLVVESAVDANSFAKLKPAAARGLAITTNVPTAGDTAPLSALSDGKLAQGYGSVFPNRVANGTYKIDLGTAKEIAAFTAWSCNFHGTRGPQAVTVYASASESDPGWDLASSRFVPLGSVVATSPAGVMHLASSLRPANGSFGKFRWVLVATSPVTGAGENTAFQEFQVQTK